MIKTDGLCILQPICLAVHYNTTPMSGSRWRAVMKFAASLEYLPAQLSGRCGRVILCLPNPLFAQKIWKSYCCGFYQPADFPFFPTEVRHGIQSNHFLGCLPGINSLGSSVSPPLSVHTLCTRSASAAWITFSCFQRGEKWNMLEIKYSAFFSS